MSYKYKKYVEYLEIAQDFLQKKQLKKAVEGFAEAARFALEAAEEVSGTDKLLKLEVTLGEEKRTLVAGVKKHYSAKEILGKKIVIVTNLQPVKLRGIESQGMLLAAVDKDNVVLLTIDKDITEGSKIQ